MRYLNQKKVEIKDKRKKKMIFKSRSKGIEKKLHEFKILCGVRALLYVKSEFNAAKNGRGGLVRILPENPNECLEIVRDFINHDPKTARKRKRGTDKEVVDSKCLRKDVKEENQEVNFLDQNQLRDLSVEEVQRIERNLEPMFGMISERIDKLMMEKKKSVAKGCNEDESLSST